MSKERRDRPRAELVEPECAPGDEEEQVQLEEDAQTEDQTVVPVDLDRRSDIAERRPSVQLV